MLVLILIHVGVNRIGMLTGWLASGKVFHGVVAFCGVVTWRRCLFHIPLEVAGARGRPFLKESLIKAYPCQVWKDTLKGCRGMEMRKSIYTEQRRLKSLGGVGKALRMSSIPWDHLIEGILEWFVEWIGSFHRICSLKAPERDTNPLVRRSISNYRFHNQTSGGTKLLDSFNETFIQRNMLMSSRYPSRFI